MSLGWLVSALAVVGCSKAKDDYLHKTKAAEATLSLRRIERSVKTYHLANGTIPAGTAALTPETPCCEQPGQKCAPDPTLWRGAPWSALAFEIGEAHRFQYDYESDGASFVATAVGDVSCTGELLTYTLRGTIENGALETELDDPLVR